MCPVAVIRAGLDVVATISPLGSDREVTVPVPYFGSLKKLLAKSEAGRFPSDSGTSLNSLNLPLLSVAVISTLKSSPA